MFESLERDAALVFWQPAAATESLTQHMYGSEQDTWCKAGSGHLVRFTSAGAKMNRQPRPEPCLREKFGLSNLRPYKLHLGSAQPLQVEI